MSQQVENKPLAITMGEPAGVGPELIVSLWKDRDKLSLPPFVYFGSPDALTAVDNALPLQIASEADISDFDFANSIPVISVNTPAPITHGILNTDNGQAVIQSIDKAVSFALHGVVSAVVTAPINKAALYSVGFDAPGHTEYLARLCGQPDDSSVMMLTAQNLRVVPVTIHIALGEVTKNLTADKIIHAGMVAAHDLKQRFGINKPRIAIAGLNPHAGEDGAMGMEEATHIMPAVWALRDAGIEVTDPLPADTLFHAEAREKYDIVLCMYHDQALIPVKTLDFWGGVNVTLGLPIIRTSPDHGTALEIAGQGVARTDSMLAAIRLAAKMAQTSSGDTRG